MPLHVQAANLPLMVLFPHRRERKPANTQWFISAVEFEALHR